MLNLGALAFTTPWMLLGLALLPVIWWLLRITPPAPRRELFPPVRLLLTLTRTEETPQATPLWLTILRMVLAAAVVLALAHPVVNPGGRLPGDGPLLLVVDDGWAAGAGWSRREEALANLVEQAERESRPVMLLATAPPADDGPVAASRLMPAAEIRPLVRALQPKPWPVDRQAALDALDRVALERPPHVVWLSDGLDDGAAARFAEALAERGSLSVLAEPAEALARAVLPPEIAPAGFDVTVLRAGGGGTERLWLRASAEGGRLVARGAATFEVGAERATVALELPSDLRNAAVRLDVEGQASAGTVVLLDERWRRRPVGLTSGAAVEDRAQPLLSNLYYLERALTPYADVRHGELAELLARPLAVLVLADLGSLEGAEHERVRSWLEKGGVLVRFAGLRLAQNVDDLTPVRLRQGGRALGGALSWAEPARLAPFPVDSPFQGLSVPDDVRIQRQVLAEPALDLGRKTWARLADGTPLVTAERRGEGWLVLFHITANADWSNLPISGLFVDMLRRLVTLSRGVAGEQGRQSLPPLSGIDGQGRLGPPFAAALPLAADAVARTAAGPRHPPGFYGTEEARRALNLTAGLERLLPIAALPATAQRLGYAGPRETDLKPWLLALALLLALADGIAALVLRGLLRPARRVGAALAWALAPALGLGLALAVVTPRPAAAQAGSSDEFALMATLETRLAYVLTGDRGTDDLSRAGLYGLSEVLRQRTSVEPAAPMGVDIERDELVFFPLIYWPVMPGQADLSELALRRVERFMRTGGTILFDTRDAQSATPGLGNLSGASANETALRRLLRRLDIPPLVPVPQEHVLTKAFYLMQSFPGRYAGGRVWVELRPGGVNDGVSSVIIGGNDWAAAWATDEQGRPLAAVVPGSERQREMAYRFGVNLVMYTLTGNYKADQVHVPAILERLGQ